MAEPLEQGIGSADPCPSGAGKEVAAWNAPRMGTLIFTHMPMSELLLGLSGTVGVLASAPGDRGLGRLHPREGPRAVEHRAIPAVHQAQAVGLTVRAVAEVDDDRTVGFSGGGELGEGAAAVVAVFEVRCSLLAA